MLRIEITGDVAAIQHIDAIAQAFDTTPPIADVAKAAMPILQTYPPELPGQRYVRTGTLKAGWRPVPGGDVIDFVNAVPYAGEV